MFEQVKRGKKFSPLLNKTEPGTLSAAVFDQVALPSVICKKYKYKI